jgi:DNA-binding response OmpR family regulator
MTTTGELQTHALEPMALAEASEANAASVDPVLIVDDDPSVAAALKRVLEARGFRVDLACDGSAAMELITRRRYEAILTDIQMPQMTGVDLLSIVRAYDLDVPVLLMTGEPKLESAIEAVSLGALQYLVKPIANEVLVAAVERASRLRRMARAKRDALELNGRAHDEAGDRAGLTAGFERALDTLAMAFQPIVHAGRRAVYAYEALMRPTETTSPSSLRRGAGRRSRRGAPLRQHASVRSPRRRAFPDRRTALGARKAGRARGDRALDAR